MSGKIVYSFSDLDNADIQWMRFGDYAYKQELKHVKGAHQLAADMLTNENGKTVWDLGGPQGGGAAFQNVLNNEVIRRYSGGGDLYDPKQLNGELYTGPLRQIMVNLIAFKQGKP